MSARRRPWLCPSSVAVGLAWFCLAVPSLARAQGVFDAVGVRALGMGGVFTAVANDPSAVHWNPAGLVGGDLAGLTIGWHQFQLGKSEEPARSPAWRGRTSLTSLGTWPLGLSFGSTDVRALTSGPGLGLRSQHLAVKQLGVTVLQTVVDGVVVVGVTSRLLRASFTDTAPVGTTVSDALHAVAAAPTRAQTTGDFDVGVMATASRLRVGLTVRNLRSVSLDATLGTTSPLPRQARLGVSVQPADGVTLAIDLDLNAVDPLGDLRRMSALGAEIPVGSRLLVRSGVRWNLARSSGPAGAVGASIRVHRGWWIDTHFAQGSATEARQMSVGLRAGL